MIIPIEDMLWASQQKPSVTQLWQECWTADPYGSRWMPLSTPLGYSTFLSAKKVLSESGLFIFKPDKSILDGRETVGWIVRNLHGSRVKSFWEEESNTSKQEPNSDAEEMYTGDQDLHALNEESILGEDQSPQAFQEVSQTAHEHLTNSSKEFVRCDSSTPGENLQSEEAAHAPLEGASPPDIESVEEILEASLRDATRSPVATECTSPSPFDEDVLLSANQDKWSSEARVARREARPGRMKTLNSAQLQGNNPGFEYLEKCWNDDPILHSVIKKMLALFPQWEIAIVDEKLVNWDE